MVKRKIYKRKFRVDLERNNKIVWSRFFSSVTTAITRGVELALWECEPKDVFVVSHANHDFVVATVKMKVNARSLRDLSIQFQLSPEAAELA